MCRLRVSCITGYRIGDDFRHGKSVTFACPRGYVMEGVRTIKCSDGRWSNEKPSCKGEFFCLSGLVDGFLTTIKPIPRKTHWAVGNKLEKE